VLGRCFGVCVACARPRIGGGVVLQALLGLGNGVGALKDRSAAAWQSAVGAKAAQPKQQKQRPRGQ
jgi:hypothetical protein